MLSGIRLLKYFLEGLQIKQKAKDSNEFEITKITHLTNQDKSIVYCEVRKKVYIANKAFFKEKRSKKKD